MTVKQLINYLECIPVEVKEGQTPEDALLEMEVKIRVLSSAGNYSTITKPMRVEKEKLAHKDKDVIIINTGMVYDDLEA
jgi:hypothetical protein